MKPVIRPSKRQHEAWTALRDAVTRAVGYGGAAGGGKSWLGCEWLLTNCYFYPGTRWFIGREELKRLKDSTLQTWFKVCSHHKIPKLDWDLNGQGNFILFANGSRIDLLDLKFLPSDPLYERYGSSEYTGGWIEEAGEVHFNAFDTLKSRTGRQLNDKYGLLPKILLTFNPKKGWLYQEFYKPWKEHRLPAGTQFIPALVHDNPYIESGYIENLNSLRDPIQRQRLLMGDWEYDDEPNALVPYDAISDLFHNDIPASDQVYLTVDVARFGKDKTVITYWEGLKAVDIDIHEKIGGEMVESLVLKKASEKGVPRSHICIDEDGIGGGVVDHLPGVKGFVANATPYLRIKDDIPDEKGVKRTMVNFANLKSQCAWLLADYCKSRKIRVAVTDVVKHQTLIQELEQLRAKDPDNDTKMRVEPKEEMKERLGRSPDILDTFIMRMLFELRGEEMPMAVQVRPQAAAPRARSYSRARSNIPFAIPGMQR